MKIGALLTVQRILNVRVKSLEIWIIATNRCTPAVTGTRNRIHPSTCFFSGKYIWLIVSHLQCEICFNGEDASASCAYALRQKQRRRKKQREQMFKRANNVECKICKMNSNPVRECKLSDIKYGVKINTL